MKNILLLGSSALEDALAWKLNSENTVGNIFILPGNGGCLSKPKTRNLNIDINNEEEFQSFLTKENISYAILSSYKKSNSKIEEILEKNNIPFIGPPAKVNWFFNSRINIKNFFLKYSIPSQSFQIIETFENLKDVIENFTIKKIIYSNVQNGWKGAYLLESKGQGSKILESIEIKVNEKSDKFIIENYSRGEEFSATIAIDGSNYILFPILRTYPKSFDYDYGLYTSGMGSFTPCPTFTSDDLINLNEKIIFPIIEGLKEENLLYQGFLTIQFIKTSDKLIAMNIIPTLSSPEIETLVPILNVSLNSLCLSIISKSIIKFTLKISSDYSLSVVLASKGYPFESEKGILIAGLDKNFEDINIFHNKTSIIKYSKNRGFITNGGRVLTINSNKSSLDIAKNTVYNIIDSNQIFFEGNYYRNDIAEKYLKK